MLEWHYQRVHVALHYEPNQLLRGFPCLPLSEITIETFRKVNGRFESVRLDLKAEYGDLPDLGK